MFDVDGLELTHLRYFVVLAEELHFGRAALRLHISQPPLTQQIQRLEARIGHALLRRTSRRVELTAAGRTFHDTARAVLQEARHALDTTRKVGRGEEGHLTLATPPSLMLDALPRVIRRFRDRFPAVDLRLREMSTSRIYDALESSGADVGIVRGPHTPESLPRLASWSEDLVALLPRGHVAAKTHRFALRQLASQPFVFFPRDLGPGFYESSSASAGGGASASHRARGATVVECDQFGECRNRRINRSGGGRKLLSGAVEVRALPRRSTQVHLLGANGREHSAVRHFAAIARAGYRVHEPATLHPRAFRGNGPS